jgi:predicted SnoaL-like aldol condensation-catalyzing enzyme
MNTKKIIQDFYKSDALINPMEMKEFIHPDVLIEWNSSKGFIQMKYDDILAFTTTMSKAYIRTKVRISHLLQDGNMVTVRFSHFAKTIENPREEMLLAHFIAIFEIKDNKIYRGYQISQIS